MTVAKRNKSRIHIYLDRGHGEEYGFTISEDVFIRHHLRKGMELTEDKINTIREEDILDKAFQKTLQFLSYRMRSKKEIYDYLREQDVPEQDALEMIDRLTDLHLINDLQFAEAFVRTKKNTQKKGSKLIEQELYEKGISQELIEKAMFEYPVEEQLDNAISVCEKKKKKYSTEAQRNRKQKLFQFLLQRGFTQSIANEAIAHVEQEFDEGEEWAALVKQATKAEKKFQKYDGWEQEQRIKQYLYQKGFPIELIEGWLKERGKS